MRMLVTLATLLLGLALVFWAPSAKADCPHGTKFNHPHCPPPPGATIFELVDNDGAGVVFGEILSITRDTTHVEVTVFLTNDDFTGTPLVGPVALQIVDGLFARQGIVFFSNDSACTGLAFLPLNLGFFDVIAPSAVIVTGATSRQFYAATSLTTQTLNETVSVLDNEDNCSPGLERNITVVPAAEAVTDLHASEFLADIRLKVAP